MNINYFKPEEKKEFSSSFARSQSTGFPSPAEDYLEVPLDLTRLILKSPSTTLYGIVRGDSMKEAGLENGDLLVIDKSLSYRNHALVVCNINGEFALKKIKVEGKMIILTPYKNDSEPIIIKNGADISVWGVVTYIIKKMY
jgi:DNA polymerase V